MAEDFRLTVTPQGSGTAQLQAASAEVATAKRPWDMFKGVVTTVPKAAGVLYEKHLAETNSEELRQGTARAAEILAETSTLSAKDRDIILTAEYDQIMLGESENSDVHNKAFLSAITPTYFSAKSKAQAEFNMGNASLAVDGLIVPEMLPEGYDKTEGLDWIAKENGVDVAVVRNMYLAKQTDYFAGQMLLQDTPEGVAGIKTQIVDNRKSLQSSKFYGSKAADWTSAIKQSDAKLQATEVQINKKFKKEALNRIAIATGDTAHSTTSYNTPFVEVQEDFKRAYGDNPETYRNKIQDYKDKAILAEESRAWQAQFEPGDVHTVIPDNPQLKDEWQKSVSVDLSKAFLENSYDKFIDISINDSAFVKKAGEDLMTSFNNIDNPIALTAFVNKLDTIGYHTNGAGALRQVLGDDNYVKVIATKYFASTGYANDIVGARAAIERGAANITQVSMSPKIKMDMGEYATKLGTQSQGFTDVMKRLHQINPQMAQDEIKNVADFFSKQVTTEGDTIVDTSMSPYIDNKSLDGDRTKTALMEKLAKDSGGKVDRVIVVGDSVISLDNLSGSMAIASVSKQAEATNEKILYEKQVEAENEEYFKEAYPLLGDIGQATDVFGQVVLGQLPSVFAAFGSSMGDLVDRFTGHVAKNWEEDTKDIREFVAEILPQEKEQVMDEFDKFIAETVTVNPVDGVAHNTMSHYDNMTLANVLANNQHKVEVAKKLRAEVDEQVAEEYTIVDYEDELDTIAEPYEYIPEVVQAKVVPKEVKEPVVNQEDLLAETYSQVITLNEGNFNNASFLHKPTAGSGWTIANGLDAAHTTADDMRKYEVPDRIIKYMEANNAFGTTKVKLPKGQKRALRMTKEEFATVNRNIAKESVPEMQAYLKKNPKLSTESLAYLAQIKHWAGSFKSGRISKTTRKIGGKLVSPINDLLESGQATPEKLIGALETIKKSYVGKGMGKGNGKGTYRYATVSRYINELKKTLKNK